MEFYRFKQLFKNKLKQKIMETIIGVSSYLLIIFICYYINRYIVKKTCEESNIWDWSDVKTNVLFSFIFPLSILYWLWLLISNIPRLPEEPPKWL